MNHSRPFPIPGVLALLFSTITVAGIGDIDSAYGNRGILSNRADVNTMTAMPDGRVATAYYRNGYIDLFMADSNGQPDTGFGPDGQRSFRLDLGAPNANAFGTAAAAAPDGRIYLAFAADSQTSAQLVRVSSAGVIDPGFGVNGVVPFPAPVASTSSAARILSIAPLANGQVAVLVGYFQSIYDCADDLRILRLTSSGLVEFEYDRSALQAAVGACSEFGGVTLTGLPNGYVSFQAGEKPTVFDALGKPVTLHLEQTGITGQSVSLAPDPVGGFVYVAGPTAHQAGSCAISRTLTDLSHTGIDGDGDDWVAADFSAVIDAQSGIKSCKVLVGGATGFVYVEALVGGIDGKTMVAIARLRMHGYYYPYQDRTFGTGGMAVLGKEAAFGLFAEQADGSLLLNYGGYAGGPAQGGDAVIRLLNSDVPSPGMIFLEAPPYPVSVVGGTPTTISVRRALGSSGAMTARYVVTAQHGGPPITHSQVRTLTLNWGDGEQGARIAEALSANDAVGHYDVDAASTPAAVFFDVHGKFSITSPPLPTSGGPVTSQPSGSGSSNEVSGGGSLDWLILMLLVCLLICRLSDSTCYSRSRNR